MAGLGLTKRAATAVSARTSMVRAAANVTEACVTDLDAFAHSAEREPATALESFDEPRTRDSFDGTALDSLNEARRLAVRDEFLWSWQAYERHAWGRDELRPLSQTSEDWVPGGMGLTILDSLDSLWLMGFEEELARARAFVANLSFDVDAEVNTFETTIRALGGLLSAHALTGDALYLQRALDLGKRLLAAFKTATGLPAPNINLRTRKPGRAHWSYKLCTAEMGSLSVEFHHLSRATNDTRFADAVARVGDHLAKHARRVRPKHLLPIFFEPDGSPSGTDMTSLGARGDSYYEYLLKRWLLGGQREPKLRARYLDATRAIATHLVQRTARGVAYVSEQYPHGPLRPKMDHLACFLPGMLALGAATAGRHGGGGASNRSAAHLALAEELMETCWLMYANTPTGLAAEIAVFHQDGALAFSSSAQDSHSLLRPETVESLFVLWRLTRDPTHRERGWKIFEAFRRHGRVEAGGYASVESVQEAPVRLRDKMESFWLSETLKYLYLLFSDDDVLPLDRWVFNTEAHPLPVEQPPAPAES